MTDEEYEAEQEQDRQDDMALDEQLDEESERLMRDMEWPSQEDVDR